MPAPLGILRTGPPKKRLRMKKVKVPELVLLYSRTSSNTLIFLVKIYWGLTLRTFREEQLADQFRYFNFSSYLVIFRADQSKQPPCIYRRQIFFPHPILKIIFCWALFMGYKLSPSDYKDSLSPALLGLLVCAARGSPLYQVGYWSLSLLKFLAQ